MRVAVTGSTGFLGTALLPALERAGHEVAPVHRGDGPPPRWDPETGTIDAGALEGVDAIVHLAGEGIGERRWTPEQKQRILRSRTAGTDLIARTAVALDPTPSVLVTASAIGYYGDRGEEELTEESTPGESFLAHVVQAWEASTAPAADAGIRVVALRTGVVLARKGGALGRMLLPFQLGLGGRMGSGGQWMSWISVDDALAGYLHALATPSLAGPVNLTAPVPVRNDEFAKTLGRVLRRPTVLPTPLFPLKLVYGAELVEQLLVEGQRALPRRLLASGFTFTHTTIEAALRSVLDRPAAV
ncbi:MAG: TIGR01777 family oxidoreductase [Acidimicrobiia bacterium]